jgi:hypothetical protein
MTIDEWVSAKDAFARLEGISDDPGELLLRLVREGRTKARASSVDWDSKTLQGGRFQDRNSTQLKPQFWRAVSEKGWKDWLQGCFGFDETAPTDIFGVGETLHWSATGVEFNWLEVLRQIGPLSEPPNSMRGTLLTHAKPNDHHYEKAAHQAAEMVRELHIKPGTAFSKVAKNYSIKINTSPTSATRAMRQVYNLMYDDGGMPHPK